MRVVTLKRILCVMILGLLIATVVPPVVLAAQTDATEAISKAQSLLVDCYNAAKDAEAAGANITALQVTLNAAGELLSRAELAYSNGDYDSAVNYANQSQRMLDNFNSEANALRASGTQQRNQAFLVNIVGSIVGVIVVVGAGVAFWIWLERKTGVQKDGHTKG